MSHGWNTTMLISEGDVLRTLIDLRGKRWLSRGHSQCRDGLVPSIDRKELKGLLRSEKLQRERRSIDQFRSMARFFASRGAEGSLVDDRVDGPATLWCTNPASRLVSVTLRSSLLCRLLR